MPGGESAAIKAGLVLLRASDKFEAEVRSRLVSKGFAQVECDEAVRWLIAKGALNDRRTLDEYLDRIARKGAKGRLWVSADLENRGLPPELIAEALERITDEEEVRKALDFLGGAAQRGITRTKAARALCSRGFEGHIVEAAIAAFEICERELLD